MRCSCFASSLIAGLTLSVSLGAFNVTPGTAGVTVRIGNAFTGGRSQPRASGILGVAAQRGLLEKELAQAGVKVEWSYFKGISAAVNEALANDSIDIAATSDLGAVIGRGSGLKFKIIAAGSQPRIGSALIAVPIDSTVQRVEDLKGKRVACANASNFQLALERVLQIHGMSRADIQYYNMGPAEGVAALGAHGVDAALYGGQGQLFVATDKKLAKIIYDSKDDKRYLDKWKSATVLLVTDKFATAHPDVVQQVVNGYIETAHWGSQKANADEWYLLNSRTGIAQDQLRRAQEGRGLRLVNSPLLDDLFQTHIRETVDLAAKAKLIKAAYSLGDVMDGRYLSAALKQLKLQHYWDAYDSEGIHKIPYRGPKPD
jgi:sulfonate transport system substrate-binding protein